MALAQEPVEIPHWALHPHGSTLAISLMSVAFNLKRPIRNYFFCFFFSPAVLRNDFQLVHSPSPENSGRIISGSGLHFPYEGMKYMKPANLFQELIKTNSRNKSRLLGLDVGDKYVGLAVSDVNNKIASPLSVLLRKKSNIDLMASDFELLISQLSLTGFVIGYPFDRQQRNSANAVQVKLFIDDLCKTGKLEGVRYTFWDECFTSKNVEFLLKPLNLHPVHCKTIMDKFAAVGILQGYLDFVNRSHASESTK